MKSSLKRMARMLACVCAAALLSLTLASCGGDESKKTPAQLNREYMASVNSISTEAADALASFNEAVSAGDIAGMRLAASDAAKKLEKISALTAPEPLAQVHEEYKAGVADLTAALSGYIEAYAVVQNDAAQEPETETQTTQSGSSKSKVQDQVQQSAPLVDSAAFAAQLEEVQALYDSGIKHLSDADAMVAQLAGGDAAATQPGDEAQPQPDEQAAESGEGQTDEQPAA